MGISVGDLDHAHELLRRRRRMHRAAARRGSLTIRRRSRRCAARDDDDDDDRDLGGECKRSATAAAVQHVCVCVCVLNKVGGRVRVLCPEEKVLAKYGDNVVVHTCGVCMCAVGMNKKKKKNEY